MSDQLTFKMNLEPYDPYKCERDCIKCKYKTYDFMKITSYRLGLHKWDQYIYCGILKDYKDRGHARKCKHYDIEPTKDTQRYKETVQKHLRNGNFVKPRDWTPQHRPFKKEDN